MAFTRTQEVSRYLAAPPPTIGGNDREYLQRELRAITTAVEKLVRAVDEIQEHLESLP
jgi:hypothetical protein